MAEEQIAQPSKLVCFALQEQEFAADIQCVKESLPQRPITRVPFTPTWLLGIINLRGDVIAIVDLSQYLGMGPTILDPNSRIIVTEVEGRRLGFVCDRLRNLRTISPGDVQASPATLAAANALLIVGVASLDDGQTLQILDLHALYHSPELAVFRRGAKR